MSMILIVRGHINPEASNMTRKGKWKISESDSAKLSVTDGRNSECLRKLSQICVSWIGLTSAGLNAGSGTWRW